MRDEATTVVARDGHSEINNVEESHLFILPLIGAREASTVSSTPSTVAANDEGRTEKKKKRRKKGKGGKEREGREDRRGSNGRKRRPSGTRSYLDEDHLRSLVIR